MVMLWSSWHNHTGDGPAFSYCASADMTVDLYRQALRTGPWQSFALTEHAFAIALPSSQAWPNQWFYQPEKLWAERSFREDKTAQYLQRIADVCDGEQLYSGMEVEVACDGSLSMDDSLWPYLDVVIGSIHYLPDDAASTYDEFFAQMRALLSYPISIIGHPFRALAQYGHVPEEIMTETLQLCKSAGVALEINAHIPFESDPALLRQAAAMGLTIAFSLDSHHRGELELHSYFAQVLAQSELSIEEILLFQPLKCRQRAERLLR